MRRIQYTIPKSWIKKYNRDSGPNLRAGHESQYSKILRHKRPKPKFISFGYFLVIEKAALRAAFSFLAITFKKRFLYHLKIVELLTQTDEFESEDGDDHDRPDIKNVASTSGKMKWMGSHEELDKANIQAEIKNLFYILCYVCHWIFLLFYVCLINN